MHLSLPILPTRMEGGALGSVLRSRRDAGLCGASLSADLPLADRIEHMILLCQGVLDSWGAVQVFVFAILCHIELGGVRPRVAMNRDATRQWRSDSHVCNDFRSLTGFTPESIIGWLFSSLPRWRNRQTR